MGDTTMASVIKRGGASLVSDAPMCEVCQPLLYAGQVSVGDFDALEIQCTHRCLSDLSKSLAALLKRSGRIGKAKYRLLKPFWGYRSQYRNNT